MEKPWLAHYDDDVPAAMDYPRIPLHQTLQDSARKYPNQTALNLVLRHIGPMVIGARLSYRQVMDQVNRFASAILTLSPRAVKSVGLPSVPPTMPASKVFRLECIVFTRSAPSSMVM